MFVSSNKKSNFNLKLLEALNEKLDSKTDFLSQGMWSRVGTQ